MLTSHSEFIDKLNCQIESMTGNIRLGVLVPSSNTALEPLTYSIISSINSSQRPISVHFSRFPVTKINLEADGLAQFQLDVVLAAAKLLADARVDVIGWSGTSAGWLGFATDETLCRTIQARTGIPATTSTLALNKALKIFDVKQLGLVTPYIGDVNSAIMKNYSEIGFNIGERRERHLDITDNNIIATVTEETLDGMVQDVIANGAGAITTFCTNLTAAQRVEHWEGLYDVPVFDTVSVVVWDMLRIVGVETSQVHGWGRLFRK